MSDDSGNKLLKALPKDWKEINEYKTSKKAFKGDEIGNKKFSLDTEKMNKYSENKLAIAKPWFSAVICSYDASLMSETVLSPGILHSTIHPITNHPYTSPNLLPCASQSTSKKTSSSNVIGGHFHKNIICFAINIEKLYIWF